MTAPARWRPVTENDVLDRWQCDGDGVDLCRAPANWIAEHEHEGVAKVVGQRCLDHLPVRAIASLSTLPAPASPTAGEPATPPVEPLASLPETIETPIASPVALKDVETEPALADTQPADRFKSPPPAPSSSIPPVARDIDETEEDDEGDA